MGAKKRAVTAKAAIAIDLDDVLRWREVLAHLRRLTAAETKPKRKPNNKPNNAVRRARRTANGKQTTNGK